MKAINFLVAGVGGQGALLVSNVLAEVGLRSGYDVKKSEVHGMSQRGGSVTSHVRWGQAVRSPVIGPGEADYLLALEKLEAAREITRLRPGGAVLVGDFCLPPLSVTSAGDRYPDDAEIARLLRQVTANVQFVPTIALAEALGDARAHNIVLLGALSLSLPAIPEATWLAAIAGRVPAKHVELNRRAFAAGRRPPAIGG